MLNARVKSKDAEDAGIAEKGVSRGDEQRGRDPQRAAWLPALRAGYIEREKATNTNAISITGRS